MAQFLDLLRDGDWLTLARMRLWALAVLIAAAGGFLYLVVTSDGLMDYQDRPLGTDFSNVYAAGTFVLEGKPAAPFEPRLQNARERELFGEKTPFYGWHYPPFFLWLAAVLALMPYQLALAVWQAVTLGFYLWAVFAITGSIPPLQEEGDRRSRSGGVIAPQLTRHGAAGASPPSGFGRGMTLLLALAYPAVFVNLGHGHNGFLTAPLIGFALSQLDTGPILAGILFGLLAYKPQFGIMIPLVLIAT